MKNYVGPILLGPCLLSSTLLLHLITYLLMLQKLDLFWQFLPKFILLCFFFGQHQQNYSCLWFRRRKRAIGYLRLKRHLKTVQSFTFAKSFLFHALELKNWFYFSLRHMHLGSLFQATQVKIDRQNSTCVCLSLGSLLFRCCVKVFVQDI